MLRTSIMCQAGQLNPLFITAGVSKKRTI